MATITTKKTISDLKAAAQKGLSAIDVDTIRDKAAEATSSLVEKAGELKDAAVAVKDDITDKLTELDRMLQESVTEYNDAYTIMNDKGVQLYIERCRSIDSISFVESLVNSIANRPKSFDAEFEEISVYRRKFTESREFADRELQEARKAAAGAGAGLAAGASVAFMAPTAAMWVATTFGTASTGAAISTLSGAAATNAALAWLGGGALAAGGGGMTAGSALLASVLCIALDPLVETFFHLATPAKLLELSNPNHPLLRRLLIEASGTYHHSIIVANLAEAAAEAVGGNPLLARAGAYFHDIGKLKRPLYFKENQIGDNPHEHTNPYVSAAIVTAHTRDGLIMAQQYRLPQEIQDIIVEHHGDTPVMFFYHKALQEADGQAVDIADFRYDGRRPQSKESAIIMLADTVEAAVRSMHDPTPQKIREFISKLVRGKLDDGQLDNAPLTLRDITRICDAFSTVLNGVFHERIEYPAISPAAAAHVAAQARLTEAAESPVEERELHRIQPEEGNASGGDVGRRAEQLPQRAGLAVLHIGEDHLLPGVALLHRAGRVRVVGGLDLLPGIAGKHLRPAAGGADLEPDILHREGLAAQRGGQGGQQPGKAVPVDDRGAAQQPQIAFPPGGLHLQHGQQQLHLLAALLQHTGGPQHQPPALPQGEEPVKLIQRRGDDPHRRRRLQHLGQKGAQGVRLHAAHRLIKQPLLPFKQPHAGAVRLCQPPAHGNAGLPVHSAASFLQYI